MTSSTTVNQPSPQADIIGPTCAALAEATGCSVAQRQQEKGHDEGASSPDVLLTLNGGSEETATVAVVALRHAYPRDIREAVWTLDEYRLSMPAGAEPILLIAAETISPGARELLRKRGIAYFERSGTLYLRWRTWLVNIERPATAIPRGGDTLALFTDAREMVIHTLLRHTKQWLTGTELADLANTSSYTCSMVLKELERREWCETRGAGKTLRRRLVRPRQLLDAWAQHWIQRKETRSRWYYLPSGSVSLIQQVTQAIERTGVTSPWALTGAAPANVIAPLLTNIDVVDVVVPPGQTEAIVRALKAKPAEKGANVSIVERGGAGMQFLEFNKACQAYLSSPFVMYMDLLDGRGRNKELAQAMREKLMEN